MAREGRFCFVRRVVTRPPLEGEDHEVVDDKTFATRQNAGAFAFAWRAHGLQYGIPAEIGLRLAEGKIVVASVSRTVLTEAAARYPLHVVEITAPPDVLARRLAARGRDDAVAVAARLARTVKLPEGRAARYDHERRHDRAGRAQAGRYSEPDSGSRSASMNGAPGAASVNRQSSLTQRSAARAAAKCASAAGRTHACSAALSRRVSVAWKRNVPNT